MSSSTSPASLIGMPQELVDDIAFYIRSAQSAPSSNCDLWSLAHTNKTLRSKILPALFEVIPITTRSYNDDYLKYITTDPIASMVKEFVVYDMPPDSVSTNGAWQEHCSDYDSLLWQISADPLCTQARRVHFTSSLVQQRPNLRLHHIHGHSCFSTGHLY
jgi:hypothetical protein